MQYFPLRTRPKELELFIDMAFLHQIGNDGTPVERWELTTGLLVVGRGEFADAFVEDDSLSRSHFLITNEGSHFCLIDLQSRNGTWVNGERILAHKLRPNELIAAGESLFYFSEAPVTAFVLPAILALQGIPALPQPRV